MVVKYRFCILQRENGLFHQIQRKGVNVKQHRNIVKSWLASLTSQLIPQSESKKKKDLKNEWIPAQSNQLLLVLVLNTKLCACLVRHVGLTHQKRFKTFRFPVGQQLPCCQTNMPWMCDRQKLLLYRFLVTQQASRCVRDKLIFIMSREISTFFHVNEYLKEHCKKFWDYFVVL